MSDYAPVDWSNTYLLGWYDRDGNAYLSTWTGAQEGIEVVVLNCPPDKMPMWDAPIPNGVTGIVVPPELDGQKLAHELGGYYAFGWKVPVTRRSASAPSERGE